MAESGLLFRSLRDIAGQIRRKDVSPVEVTRTVLDRLEHLNPRLNAFMTSFGEQALAAAKRAEEDLVAGQPRGPLHGMPLARRSASAPSWCAISNGFSRRSTSSPPLPQRSRLPSSTPDLVKSVRQWEPCAAHYDDSPSRSI